MKDDNINIKHVIKSLKHAGYKEVAMNITKVGMQTATTNQTQSYFNKGTQEGGERIDISGQLDDAVALEISMEGMKKLDESALSQDRDISRLIKPLENGNKSIDHLVPAYSGIASADQAIHDALKNADNDTRAFVYRTIRNNFLVKDASELSEEERQANISLGMEKATFAANTMLDEGHRKSFLDAMGQIAKSASAGTRESDGTMYYGNTSKTYVGQDGRLVQSTDSLAVMKRIDKKSYETYQSLQDDFYAQMKFFMKWHSDNLEPVSEFVKEEDEKKEEVVKTAKVDKTFNGAGSATKEAFISFLQQFAEKNPGFMTSVINREQLTWAK